MVDSFQPNHTSPPTSISLMLICAQSTQIKKFPPSFRATRGWSRFPTISPSTYGMAAMNLGHLFCIWNNSRLTLPLMFLDGWELSRNYILFHWTLCTPVHQVSLNVLELHRSYQDINEITSIKARCHGHTDTYPCCSTHVPEILKKEPQAYKLDGHPSNEWGEPTAS